MCFCEFERAARVRQRGSPVEYLKPGQIAGGDFQYVGGAGSQQQAIDDDTGVIRSGHQRLAAHTCTDGDCSDGIFVDGNGHGFLRFCFLW